MDMEEKEITPSSSSTSSSIRPTAFTIDFGDEKKVDLARHKSLAEKFQQRHKRGKSMSKLDESAAGVAPVVTLVAKKQSLSGNLPRKSSFYQLDQGSSAEEKSERFVTSATKRGDLRLPLENINSDLMTHSFPNQIFSSSSSLFNNNNSSDNLQQQISSISPEEFNNRLYSNTKDELLLKSSSAMNLSSFQVKNSFIQQDHESDTVSEAGTYTLDVDYSEEQKARMSIDNEFKIEKISVEEKAAEYIKSLSVGRYLADDNCFTSPTSSSQISCCSSSTTISSTTSGLLLPPVPPLKKTQQFINSEINNKHLELLLKKTGEGSNNRKLLSPIMSPTQNISLIDDNHIKNIKNPVSISKIKSDNSDEGTVISVSSSGAFKSKNEEKLKLEEKKRNLSKSAVHVEAYVDGKIYNDDVLIHNSKRISKLTANIVNIQSIEVNNSNNNNNDGAILSASFSFGKGANNITTGLPPPSPGKCSSPSKIPSPIHTLSRPRSRINSPSGDDFDTEMILKPTRNYINSLQHKLSLDNTNSSDQDSDYDMKYGLQLNNTAHLLNKQRSLHTRHNSLDDRTMMINNKLEHFQTKNLQTSIDQTYNTNNVFSQYHRNNSNKIVNKINNSPNNSPVIRRSSSFSSNRNHQMNNVKSSNIIHMTKKDSPNNLQIHRSSSTACIKPTNSRPKNNEHRKIDRNQFGDTETSSEDDLLLEVNNLQKKKDLGSLSNTRCNRTFSLRRARIDNNADAINKMNKCPNTPDMRRKLNIQQSQVLSKERAISVDRKPVKTTEVQSRYLLSLNKRASSIAKEVPIKNVPKTTQLQQKTCSSSSANFSRNEGGRFSMRAPKPTTTTTMSNNSIVPKKDKKVKNNSKQQNGGGRCNSSLSSREVEFQNWKRRKSYDPMKAAAEGKKKELEKRLISEIANNTGNKPINTSPDSSPSHSGSVHRSQSFHGTAALGQLLLISSDDEDDDLTFSNDEGFSPPTPSPCELSPSKKTGLLKNSLLWERLRN